MTISYSETKYSLKLANGHLWTLLATIGAEPWLNRIAKVMSLQVCESEGNLRIVLDVEEASREKCKNLVSTSDMPQKKAAQNAIQKKTYSNTHALKYRCRNHSEGTEIVYCVDQNETCENNMFRMWFLPVFIGRREQLFGGLVCHGGLVEKNGNGVLFLGSGGAGKSTCCRRILSPWQARADDQVFILPDEEGRYKVHPMPTWSEFLKGSPEKVWYVQESYYLSAIFILQKSEEDAVIPVQSWKAPTYIYKSAMEGNLIGCLGGGTEERIFYREGWFNNACDIAKRIPTYTLKVSLNGTFWKEIDKVTETCL